MAKRKAVTKNKGKGDREDGGEPERSEAAKEAGATSPADTATTTAANDANDAKAVTEDAAVVQSSAARMMSFPPCMGHFGANLF